MSSAVASAEGKLEVHIIGGRNLPNRTRFGKQDSIVELAIGTTKKRTQVDKKGGATPQWNDRLFFSIGGLGKTQLMVRALELDGPHKFEDIGSCVVDLARIFEEEEVDGWYALKHKERPAGQIYIEFTYTPRDGRKRPSKADLAEEDELDTTIPAVAPKVSTPADTLASAPSPLPPQTLNGNSQPGTANTAPSGKASGAPARPALSEVRPYSSASGYRPELVAQYANKHGKKPLPVPVASGTISGGMPPAMMPMGTQFGQTMLPGQFAMGQPNMFGTMANNVSQPVVPVPPMAGMQGQVPQPMGTPQLMNLFSPPNSSDMAVQGKVLPQPPEPVPAFNPAYMGASIAAQPAAAAPPAPSKVLPQPPVAPNSRVTNMGLADQPAGYPAPNQSPGHIQQQPMVQQQPPPQPQQIMTMSQPANMSSISLPQMQFPNDSMMFVPDPMMSNAGGFIPGGATPVPMMMMQGQPQIQQMTAASQMQLQPAIYGTMQPQMQTMYQQADLQMQMVPPQMVPPQMMQPQMMYPPGAVPDPSAPPMMMSYENLQFSQPNFQQPQQPQQPQPQFNPAAYGMQQQYYPSS